MLFGVSQRYAFTYFSKAFCIIFSKVGSKLLLDIHNSVYGLHDQGVVILAFVVLEVYIPAVEEVELIALFHHLRF